MHHEFDHLDKAVIAITDVILLSIVLAIGTLVPGVDLAWLLGGYIIGCVVRAISNGWAYYQETSR